MELIDLVKTGESPSIAFVGAGGKTSAIFSLARQLTGKVIVAATTHLAEEQLGLADTYCTVASPAAIQRDWKRALKGEQSKVILFAGKLGADSRTTGLTEDEIESLHDLCKSADLPLLIEADGSRQKPLKAPGAHEPVIPFWTDMVVVTAGLTGLNKPLEQEWVHRPEIFALLSGLPEGALITPQALARVLTHPTGGLKNIPNDARRVALLNQADSPRLRSLARQVESLITPAYDGVIITSIKP